MPHERSRRSRLGLADAPNAVRHLEEGAAPTPLFSSQNSVQTVELLLQSVSCAVRLSSADCPPPASIVVRGSVRSPESLTSTHAARQGPKACETGRMNHTQVFHLPHEDIR